MPIPPLSLSASAGASGQMDVLGNKYAFGEGSVWNVNLGGHGDSTQGAAASTAGGMWMYIAMAAVAYVLLTR